MAETTDSLPKNREKSQHALREERILKSWKEKDIFGKSLEKNKGGKEFVFYEGPPTANGRPGIHHLEARAFKDAIPRYKTMRGFHVRRKGGWDTHGLPVELQVEKSLGLKSKKEIESYGVAAFNEKCKESVWTYVHEWEDFTQRMGYWVDLKDPYITYKPEYIESLWNIVKTVAEKGLLYKDYKVVPWCPRCGTGLSSHELAQGYADVKDLSVYAKFRLLDRKNTFVLAWTTTPWTLPGNVALAVNEKIDYVEAEMSENGETYILAKDRLSVLNGHKYEVKKTYPGSELVGREYEPLYKFLKENISGPEKQKLHNAYKIYPADFVTTADGTGVVHTAVMYGQDDFELGNKVGLPKFHLVGEDGVFKLTAGFLGGSFVKDPETDVAIIKDLAHRGLLFHKEKYEHSYPFCWRCKTPLIYYARDSWYIRMSDFRKELVKENEDIHWEPEHFRDGRFGEWLKEVKDWAISRERYWGTPLPVWMCDHCGNKKVVGSVEEIAKPPRNTYYLIRHGEAQNNIQGILSGIADTPHHLTEKGKEQVLKAAKQLKKIKFDLIFASPFIRTQETLNILKDKLGWKPEQVKTDVRIRELGTGTWEGRKVTDYWEHFADKDRFASHPDGVENYAEIKKRMGDFLYDMEAKYEGKTILVVTHETPEFLLASAAHGLNRTQTIKLRGRGELIKNAEVRKLEFKVVPHNSEYELDLHKPYIDTVKLPCATCGKEMSRVKEVMDVWFDSGAMPFAQDHYPFDFPHKLIGGKKLAYPADFISEAVDQTRGWFYTLHAIGILMDKGKAFKNVICLGHILDAEGKKMSKSLGNILDPWMLMDKYGADALRFWMYSVNQPGESKNFEEKTVDEINKKVFNLVSNVAAFYKMYIGQGIEASDSSAHVLDRWIISRLNELVATVTANMDKYVFLESTRAVRDFVSDLSQWYLRRSRDRFREEGKDKLYALQTTKHVLVTLSKIMAPFTPFFAEELYSEVGLDKESVHLENWPGEGKVDEGLIRDMNLVRKLSSLGLEARMNAKLNVRQPLASLKINPDELKSSPDFMNTKELVDLICDEVNVKNVVLDPKLDKSAELDTNLTPELREEGELRELLRKIQDMRKEKNLNVGDKAKLVVGAELESLIGKYGDKIKAATNVTSIEIGPGMELKVS